MRKLIRKIIKEHIYGSRQYNSRMRPVNPIDRVFDPEDREKAQNMFNSSGDGMGFDDMAFELGRGANKIIPNEPGATAIEPQTRKQFDAQMSRYDSEELRNKIMNSYDWQTESQLIDSNYDYKVYLDEVMSRRAHYGDRKRDKSPHEDYAKILGCNVNDLRFLYNQGKSDYHVPEFSSMMSLLYKLEKTGSWVNRGFRLPKEKSQDIFGWSTIEMIIFSPKEDKTEPTRYRYLVIKDGHIELIVTCK